jgi:hypothetical protein
MEAAAGVPEREIKDAMRFTGAKTKREALVTALAGFNRRWRLAGRAISASAAG